MNTTTKPTTETGTPSASGGWMLSGKLTLGLLLVLVLCIVQIVKYGHDERDRAVAEQQLLTASQNVLPAGCQSVLVHIPDSYRFSVMFGRNPIHTYIMIDGLSPTCPATIDIHGKTFGLTHESAGIQSTWYIDMPRGGTPPAVLVGDPLDH